MTETQSLQRPSFLRRLSAPLAVPSIASIDNGSSFGTLPGDDSLRPPSALRMGKRLPPLLRMISFRKLRLSTPPTAIESPDGARLDQVKDLDTQDGEAGGPGFSFADMFGTEAQLHLRTKPSARQGRQLDNGLALRGDSEDCGGSAALPLKAEAFRRDLPLLSSRIPALDHRRDSPPDIDVRLSTPLKGSQRADQDPQSPIIGSGRSSGLQTEVDALDMLSSARFGLPTAFEQQRCELQPRKAGTRSLFTLDAVPARTAPDDDSIDAMSMLTAADAYSRSDQSRPPVLAPFKTRRRPVPPLAQSPPRTPTRLDEVVVIDRFAPSPSKVATPPARPPRNEARLKADVVSLRSLPAKLPNSPLSAGRSPVPQRESSLPPVPKRAGSLLRRPKASSVRFEPRLDMERRPTGPRPRPPPLALSAGRSAVHKPSKLRLEPRLEPSPSTSPRTPLRRNASGMTALSFLALDPVNDEAHASVMDDDAESAVRLGASPTWSSPGRSPHIVPPEELSLYSPRRHDRNMSESSDVTYRQPSLKSAKRFSSTTPYALTLSAAISQGEALPSSAAAPLTPRRPSTPASSPRTPGPASVFGSPMSARGKMPMSSPPPPPRSKTPYPPARTPTSPRSPTLTRQRIAPPLSLGATGAQPRPVSRSSFLLSPVGSFTSSGTPSPGPSLDDHPFFTPCPTPRKQAVRDQEDVVTHGLRLSAFTVFDTPSRPTSAFALRQPLAPLENRSGTATPTKQGDFALIGLSGPKGDGTSDKETLDTWLSQPAKRHSTHRVATFGQGLVEWD